MQRSDTWRSAYRMIVITLLVIICMQLGAWRWMNDQIQAISYAVRNIGKKEEMAAPYVPPPALAVPQGPASSSSAPSTQAGGGIDGMFQEDTDRVLDYMAKNPLPKPPPHAEYKSR